MSDQLPDFIDPKQYPDFWEQMKGFKEFAQSVGQQAAEGNGIFASEEKQKTREEFCNKCSQFNQESKRCYICGCYMVAKWRFKAASCPINVW